MGVSPILPSLSWAWPRTGGSREVLWSRIMSPGARNGGVVTPVCVLGQKNEVFLLLAAAFGYRGTQGME